MFQNDAALLNSLLAYAHLEATTLAQQLIKGFAKLIRIPFSNFFYLQGVFGKKDY
jgi:hypothetical protein